MESSDSATNLVEIRLLNRFVPIGQLWVSAICICLIIFTPAEEILLKLFSLVGLAYMARLMYFLSLKVTICEDRVTIKHFLCTRTLENVTKITIVRIRWMYWAVHIIETVDGMRASGSFHHMGGLLYDDIVSKFKKSGLPVETSVRWPWFYVWITLFGSRKSGC